MLCAGCWQTRKQNSSSTAFHSIEPAKYGLTKIDWYEHNLSVICASLCSCSFSLQIFVSVFLFWFSFAAPVGVFFVLLHHLDGLLLYKMTHIFGVCSRKKNTTGSTIKCWELLLPFEDQNCQLKVSADNLFRSLCSTRVNMFPMTRGVWFISGIQCNLWLLCNIATTNCVTN
jgi:hypothetical protein